MGYASGGAPVTVCMTHVGIVRMKQKCPEVRLVAWVRSGVGENGKILQVLSGASTCLCPSPIATVGVARKTMDTSSCTFR